MTDAGKEFKCGRPECDVTSTGVCVEGHKPVEACPELSVVFEESTEDDAREKREEGLAEDGSVPGNDIPAVPESRTNHSLLSGEALDENEYAAFLRCRPVSKVAIIGDIDTGKTTLICSIYEKFLKGPFAGYLFAESASIIAFEKRCHFSRIESGLSKPSTKRTPISDGLKYLHFAVVSEGDLKRRCDIMFSDRAGELYRSARDQSNIVGEFSEIIEADTVVLLLDGGRLTDSAERSGVMQSVRQMLRALIDGGALGTTSIVQVVTTKIDLVQSNQNRENLEALLCRFQERLAADFGSSLENLSFWRIAARDPTGNLDPAYGVEELLRHWAVRRPQVVARAEIPVDLYSEFDRLLNRTPMERLP